MTTSKPRLSVPLSVVVLAVVVAAFGGGATAAKMITGKQIKNNTVSTQDIKNASLKLKDVNKRDVRRLQDTFGPPLPGRLYTGGGAFYADSPGVNYHLAYTQLPFSNGRPFREAPRNVFFGTGISPLPGHQDTTKCAGSGSAPVPAKGVLCIYVVQAQNVVDNDMQIFAGAISGADPADRNGFHVYGRAENTSATLRFHYIWAFRAG